MKPPKDNVEYPAAAAYQDEAVAQSYDRERFHSRTGTFRHRAEAALVDWAIDLAGLSSGSRVADIPTGTGRFLPLLHQRHLSVTAVDISDAMLNAARDRIPTFSDAVRWVTADATTLPFPDDEFDAVLSVRLMNHLPPAVRADVLAQFSRIARGHVLVTFTDTMSLQGLLRRNSRRKRRIPQYPIGVSGVRTELAAAGLRLRATKHIFRGISETYMCVAEVMK